MDSGGWVQFSELGQTQPGRRDFSVSTNFDAEKQKNKEQQKEHYVKGNKIVTPDKCLELHLSFRQKEDFA